MIFWIRASIKLAYLMLYSFLEIYEKNWLDSIFSNHFLAKISLILFFSAVFTRLSLFVIGFVLSNWLSNFSYKSKLSAYLYKNK